LKPNLKAKYYFTDLVKSGLVSYTHLKEDIVLDENDSRDR
jgi:hypothetical protein